MENSWIASVGAEELVDEGDGIGNGFTVSVSRYRIRKIYKKFPRIPMPQHLDVGDDDDMQRLSEALGAAKTRAEGCSSFLKAAIKWSIEHGAHKNGSPEIHDLLADYIYSESPELDMAKVSYHFVRGKNPENFASTLVNFMGKCYPGEDDLAVARAILM
ncbi:hypothetical protein OROMI_011365 [Orobanche minor]